MLGVGWYLKMEKWRRLSPLMPWLPKKIKSSCLQVTQVLVIFGKRGMEPILRQAPLLAVIHKAWTRMC